MLSHSSLGSHCTGHLPDTDPWDHLFKPFDMPCDLTCPDRKPEPIGGWNPMLSMCPADTDEFFCLFCPGEKGFEKVPKFCIEDGSCIFQLQTGGCI